MSSSERARLLEEVPNTAEHMMLLTVSYLHAASDGSSNGIAWFIISKPVG